MLCDMIKFCLKKLARSGRRRGQAITEVVLLFPLFVLLVLITAKIFALLVLVQKMEIASFYAARRWQLESHLNAQHADWDNGVLRDSIRRQTEKYLGYGSPTAQFLNLKEGGLKLNVDRTQVWNVVTLSVETKPAGIAMLCAYSKQAVCGTPYGDNCFKGYSYMCESGSKLEVIKYVPSRDRPIKFVLPGLSN